MCSILKTVKIWQWYGQLRKRVETKRNKVHSSYELGQNVYSSRRKRKENIIQSYALLSKSLIFSLHVNINSYTSRKASISCITSAAQPITSAFMQINFQLSPLPPPHFGNYIYILAIIPGGARMKWKKKCKKHEKWNLIQNIEKQILNKLPECYNLATLQEIIEYGKMFTKINFNFIDKHDSVNFPFILRNI